MVLFEQFRLRGRVVSVPLGLGLLLVILFMTTNLMDCGYGQELNKAALQYNLPDVYMWTSNSNYDPYVPLTRRQTQLSEYVLVYGSVGLVSIHIMYYDPRITNVTEQSQRKEYYWRFLNTSSVIPGGKLRNTTFEVLVPFTPRPSDIIAFHSFYHTTYVTAYQRPPYDVTMEFPSNSGHIRRFISVVEFTTFPLARWRYSSASANYILTWEQITSKSISFRPAYPSPLNLSETIYHGVSSQDLRVLENPCCRDLFVFYLIAKERKDFSDVMHGPRTNVYFSIPLVMGERGPDWVDMTHSFCMSYTEDCANVESLVMTNNHLLAVSDRGIFVSEEMSTAPLRFLEYPDLPLLAFHLLDPCSHIRDLFYCYTEHGVNPLLHSVKLYYNPVCEVAQAPNFLDIVILVISHDTIDPTEFLRNELAWTVLYAEQPYTEWHLLIRSAITFDVDLIHNIKSAYYNHQLNHFEFVALVGKEKDAVKGWVEDDRWYVRFILPRPKKNQKPAYYEVLSTELGNGFLPKVFPKHFAFRKIEVSTGSLDIHFLGNQIWIAESGGHFVYLSVGFLSQDIEYCNFNHPDRYYICVNLDHTQIFVGKVSANYRPHATNVDELEEIRQVAIEEGWFIPPSSEFDSAGTRFVNPTYTSTEARVLSLLMRPILFKALKGVFYRVSNQGNIQIWYLSSAIKDEESLLTPRGTRKVNNYQDAIWIVTGDGNTPPPTEAAVFAEAERLIELTYDAALTLLQEKILAKSTLPARMEIVSIRADRILPYRSQRVHTALVPFFIDAITVALYEAEIPGSKIGFARTDVGNTIDCEQRTGEQTEITCDLYIRHIKFVKGWLPGFTAVAFAYILRSIPMHAFSCPTRININPRSNDAFTYILLDRDHPGEECEETQLRPPTPVAPYYFIGWTFYIPGHFSLIVTLPDEFTLYDENEHKAGVLGVDYVAVFYAKATTTVDRPFELVLSRYEGFLINMASKEYQDYVLPYPPNSIPDDQLYISLPSWTTHPSNCLFELQLQPNQVLKSSGGVVQLDLHDSLSFTCSIHAIVPQGEVMMQQVRLKVTNSNPMILGLRQALTKRLTIQTLDITVKPTGFGTGQAVVVVRALSCLPSCRTPCSLTFIFQVMRQEGKLLIIHYPIQVPAREILNPDTHGNVYRNSTVIYMRLPVNYRPPSVYGAGIPITQYIYNADPQQPMYRSTYKVSKASGVYRKCLDKLTRTECGCSLEDQLQDHPDFTDCRQMVYKIRRGLPITMRAVLPPVMDPAFQHQAFYLEKPYLVVWVEEVNGRQDYSLTSEGSSVYLDSINSDQQLARGKRFYNAEGLTFVVYGTGLYHFRAALGEFDTFNDTSGYFTVFSEEFGMDDFSFMLFFFGAVMMCFLLTLCGFLRVRKRLVGHIPMREIVDDGKVKME